MYCIISRSTIQKSQKIPLRSVSCCSEGGRCQASAPGVAGTGDPHAGGKQKMAPEMA